MSDEFDVFKPITPESLLGDSVDLDDVDQINPDDVGLGDVLDGDGNDVSGDDSDEPQIDLDKLGDDGVDPVGDAALSGLGVGEPKLKEPELIDDGVELGSEFGSEDEIEPPKWTTLPQDNNDIVSQHADGFMLRARPLSGKTENKIKYIAQLYKDNKILTKGTKWIDASVDPRTFLQNVADRILSSLGYLKT